MKTTSDDCNNVDARYSCRNGIVMAVTERNVTVRVRQASSCSTCKIQHLCGTSENRQLLVSATLVKGEQIAVGDEVELIAEPFIEQKASWLAFGVPLVIVLLWLPVAVFGIGLSDWLSVVSALGWVIAYVLLMHHWRSRWEGRFALSARKVHCQAEEQDSEELSIE